MTRDVFVWLLAVTLIRSFAWGGGGAKNVGVGNDRGYRKSARERERWRTPIVDAYWQAERVRWAEEEHRQDAMGPLRLDLPADEMLAAEPPATPARHPDVGPEEEAMLLAWGTTSAAAGQRRFLRKIRRTRLGPRATDVFAVHSDDAGLDAGGWVW